MATLSFFSPSLLPCPRIIPFRSLPPTSTTLRGWIKPRRGVVTARAASDSSESASTSLSVVKSVKSAWASPEERIGLAGLGIASIIVLWAAINTVTAIDKIPLLPSVFEFVGILFSCGSCIGFSSSNLTGKNWLKLSRALSQLLLASEKTIR